MKCIVNIWDQDQGFSQREGGGPPSFPCLNSFDVVIGMWLGFWYGHAFHIATLLSLSSG